MGFWKVYKYFGYTEGEKIDKLMEFLREKGYRPTLESVRSELFPEVKLPAVVVYARNKKEALEIDRMMGEYLEKLEKGKKLKRIT